MSMNLSEELMWRTFRFGRVCGELIGALTLRPDGTLSGYRSDNERSWAIKNDKLVFLRGDGAVTTIFNQIKRERGGYVLTGEFLPRGPGPWHMLTEFIDEPRGGVISQLSLELYGTDTPKLYSESRYRDDGYPHTNLLPDVVKSVLDTIRPRFWLECGSMLGGSAIRVADVAKCANASTEIVCVDPFTGDVNMWAWEQPRKRAGEWQFLRLEGGRPTIFERFLANVVAAGHADMILPLPATCSVGVELLRRLLGEQRLCSVPSVIYLDSAHEPDETFLELQSCWGLLAPGGVLLGDDWGWDAVRTDVLRFRKLVKVDNTGYERLQARHQRFSEIEGVLIDRGQWALVKAQ